MKIEEWMSLGKPSEVCLFPRWLSHAYPIPCFQWVKTMPFLPPMTGNGNPISPINMLITGGWCVYGIVSPLFLISQISGRFGIGTTDLNPCLTVNV